MGTEHCNENQTNIYVFFTYFYRGDRFLQYFNILVHYPSLTGWTGTGPYVGAYVLPVLVFCLRLLVSNSNCIATPPQMKDPPDPVLLITLLLLAMSLL